MLSGYPQICYLQIPLITTHLNHIWILVMILFWCRYYFFRNQKTTCKSTVQVQFSTCSPNPFVNDWSWANIESIKTAVGKQKSKLSGHVWLSCIATHLASFKAPRMWKELKGFLQVCLVCCKSVFKPEVTMTHALQLLYIMLSKGPSKRIWQLPWTIQMLRVCVLILKNPRWDHKFLVTGVTATTHWLTGRFCGLQEYFCF